MPQKNIINQISNFLANNFPYDEKLLQLTEYNFYPMDHNVFKKLKLNLDNFIVQIEHGYSLNIYVPQQSYTYLQFETNDDNVINLVKRVLTAIHVDNVDIEDSKPFMLESTISRNLINFSMN